MEASEALFQRQFIHLPSYLNSSLCGDCGFKIKKPFLVTYFWCKWKENLRACFCAAVTKYCHHLSFLIVITESNNSM